MAELEERVAELLRQMGCGESYGCDELARAVLNLVRQEQENIFRHPMYNEILGVITLTERESGNTVSPTGRRFDELRLRLGRDRLYRMRLGKALFEKEEALLPEDETWEGISDGDRSRYDKCAMAVVDELGHMLSESLANARLIAAAPDLAKAAHDAAKSIRRVLDANPQAYAHGQAELMAAAQWLEQALSVASGRAPTNKEE